MKVDVATAEKGQKLFTQLNCVACHTTAEDPRAEGKVALSQVRGSLEAGLLSRFFQTRRRIIAGIACLTLTSSRTRLPRCRFLFQSTSLTVGNFFHLIIIDSKGPKWFNRPGARTATAQTRKHFSAPPIADLAKGCLANLPGEAKSPRFLLSVDDRAALRLFLQRAGRRLAKRASRSLRCGSRPTPTATIATGSGPHPAVQRAWW
ncbi:MAG: hypothetical protein Ct9H300mP7_6230 [Verrucomicrobiota bacterium]|nr:MAG: hypothetical protein Ct9H300mP7_6230 [Verrucomicrobiota bacterium]